MLINISASYISNQLSPISPQNTYLPIILYCNLSYFHYFCSKYNTMRLKYFITMLIIAQAMYAQDIRQEYTINSGWKFKKGDVSMNDPKFNEPGWEMVNIPHCWNATDVYDEADGFYQGIVWYNKTLSLPKNIKDKKVYLQFEAVHQEAEVYLNGEMLGKHKGGYTAFTFDISSKLIHENDGNNHNEIALKADNRVNENINPLSGDWTFFGGIYRDVRIIITNPVHFNMLNNGSRGIFISIPTADATKASIKVTGALMNESQSAANLKIITRILDKDFKIVLESSQPYKLEAGKSGEFTQNNIVLKEPKLWTPETPYLYTVVSEIVDATSGLVLDKLTNSLGVRWSRFDADRGFFLNDKPLKLIGVCKHQDYPNMGNAVPDNLQQQDVQMIKDMGGNFLRLSHYPHDFSVLEACDRLGILVSIEIPLNNQITESEEFYNSCKNMMTEMIRQYYNHPSIILWSYMNEVMLRRPFAGKIATEYSERELQYFANMAKLAKDLNDIAKKEDPYRSTMLPMHGNFELYQKAGLTKIPDVVGWNLYKGWYSGEFNQLDEFISNFHKEVPNKAIIISEYGTGSDTRLRSVKPQRFDFSVEWTNAYHEYYLNYIKKTPYIAGSSVWVFADFSSEGRIDANPHINNKGIVTQFRQPKDVFYLYKANLSKEPFIKIAPVMNDNRYWLADSANAAICTQRIWVYTNLEKVELIVNRKPHDKISTTNGIAYFDVPFVNGVNVIEAWSAKEGQLYKEIQQVSFNIIPRNLKSSNTFSDILINCGSNCSFTDNSGQIWMADIAYKSSGFGYTGGSPYTTWMGVRLGSDKDILGSEDDPLFQTQRVDPVSYKFDVPNGIYEVTLCIAELQSNKERRQVIYNLGAGKDDETKPANRIFSIAINGQVLADSLDAAIDYGAERAITITVPITVYDDKGIDVSFINKQGSAIINGIKVHKTN